MPTTTNFGLEYPDSGGHARLWEWFQTLAEDIDTAFVKPIFRARRTTGQSMNNVTDTPINWEVEDVDSHNGHDLVTNPARYVFQVAGWSMLSGGVGFANGTSGRRKTEWWKNGAALDGSNVFFFPNSSGTVVVPARTLIIQHSVGDYVELRGWHESGASLATSGSGSSAPSIDVTYLRPA